MPGPGRMIAYAGVDIEGRVAPSLRGLAALHSKVLAAPSPKGLAAPCR